MGDHVIASHDAAHRFAQASGFVVSVCICAALAIVFVPGARRLRSHESISFMDEQINPNNATAASLARLPEIGPTRARMIVAHRNDAGCAFHCPEDLQAVKGIGPVTVKAIRPWLCFDAP